MIDMKQTTASIITAADIPDVLDAALALAEADFAGLREFIGEPEEDPDHVAWGSSHHMEPGEKVDYWKALHDGRMVKYTSLWALNRDINLHRMENYAADMEAGQWWFTPDPIVVSTEGRILNGQHRALAACIFLDRGAVGPLPEFVLVTGVEERAALLMDEARRTPNDRRNIAMRFAGAA